MAPESPTPSVSFRDLRRSEVGGFEKVIVQAYGRFEDATGLGEGVSKDVQRLERLGFWTLVRLLQRLRIANMRILVGVERGSVVATGLLVLLRNCGYVGGVATDRAARGRGVATGLMEQARALAQDRRKPWLVLDVESENQVAIRLYRRLEYSQVARYDWYVGLTPQPAAMDGPAAQEVRLNDRQITEWVNQQLPPAIREPLPATKRFLQHLEFFARPAKGARKTWRLGPPDRIGGVVRACYGPKIQVGFVYPIVPPGTGTPGPLQALVAPAIDWHRSLGAKKVVVAVPAAVEGWEPILTSLGLSRGVSTILMSRPLEPCT